MTEAQTDYAAALKDAFGISTRSENLLPLLVDAAIVIVGGVCTLGVLAGPLAVGYNAMAVRASRGQPIAVGDSLKGLSQLGTALVAGLLVFLAAVVLGCTVVGAPAVAFFASWVFVILAERPGTSAVDAIKASVQLALAHPVDTAVLAVVCWGLGSIASPTFLGSVAVYAFSAVLTAILYQRFTAQGAPAGLPANAPATF
ncbi:MAG: hypothetical protein HY909_22975 [Deltaproteobacteria bacterium]|nr:hypothetical protein [Deltaproteobacteria bacterium]